MKMVQNHSRIAMVADDLPALKQSAGYIGTLFDDVFKVCVHLSSDIQKDVVESESSFWNPVTNEQIYDVENSILSYIFGNDLFQLMKMVEEYESWAESITAFLNGTGVSGKDREFEKVSLLAKQHLNELPGWEKFLKECSRLARHIADRAANAKRNFQFKRGYKCLGYQYACSSDLVLLSETLYDVADRLSSGSGYAKDVAPNEFISEELHSLMINGYSNVDETKQPVNQTKQKVKEQAPVKKTIDKNAVFDSIDDIEYGIDDLLDIRNGKLPEKLRGLWSDAFGVDTSQYGISTQDQWNNLIEAVFSYDGVLKYVIEYPDDLRDSFGTDEFNSIVKEDIVSECFNSIDEHFGDYMGIVEQYSKDKYGSPITKKSIKTALKEAILNPLSTLRKLI